MKKNTASLVLAIIGAVFGIIGGLMWTACADTCADIVKGGTGYTIGFLVLGIGGAALSLVGGIQAYGNKSGKMGLSVTGLLCQIANIVLQCIFLGGFSFVLSLWSILAVILLLVATILAARNLQE